MKSLLLSILAVLTLFSCTEKKPNETLTEQELRDLAKSIAKEYIITDGHVDLPYRLKNSKFNIKTDKDSLIRVHKGDFDYERAVIGGLDAPFMSIYIPASYQLHADKGKDLADSLINMVRSIAEEMPERFAMANSVEDVEKNFKTRTISLPMGMENGAPIGDDIKNVKYFYDRGIRYVTLTHGKDNQICDSSYDTTHTWNGLSPFGREVVKEMNRVGIMVDISHVDDSTFYQVVRISKVPVIASHSSCRYFTPSFKRNMSDDMIKKLAANGGVIQINFGSTFLDSTVAKQNDENRKKLQALLADKKLKTSDSLAKPIIAQFRKDNPNQYASVLTVADHIDHVVKLVGIDYVGIGSDYDGVGDSLPDGLKDVSQYPTLIFELLSRGYTKSDIVKICSGNVFRVWKKVADGAE